MSSEELEVVRQRWKHSGELLCYHPVIAPLRDEAGTMPKAHVCQKCGVVVSKGPTNQDVS